MSALVDALLDGEVLVLRGYGRLRFREGRLQRLRGSVDHDDTARAGGVWVSAGTYPLEAFMRLLAEARERG